MKPSQTDRILDHLQAGGTISGLEAVSMFDCMKCSNRISELRALGYHIKTKVKRSIPQNKTYWMWLTCIQDETGTDKDDLHDIFKRKFLTKTVKFRGKRKRATQSTTKLSTVQFAEYMNKIQVFANTELGIILPDPDSRNWAEFEEKYRDRI